MHRLRKSLYRPQNHSKMCHLFNMLLPEIRVASEREFLVFQQDSAPLGLHRAKDTVACCWIRRRPILSHMLSCRLTYRTSTQLTTRCGVTGVCFRIKSIVHMPRSRTSTKWNDASQASGPLWVTRLLNVLLASGVSVYALTFVAGGGHFEHTL